MVIARSVTETFSVVLESDKESERPTTFRIRALPHRVMLALPGLSPKEQVELIVRAGVADWENLVDGAGAPVPARRADQAQNLFGVEVDKPLSLESLDALPLFVVTELSEAVLEQNKLTQEKVGK